MPFSKFFEPHGIESLVDQLFNKDGSMKRVVSGGINPSGLVSLFFMEAEDIKLLLVEKDFPKLPAAYDSLRIALGDGLVTSSGHKWKSQRRLITPIFHFNNLKEYTSIMQKDAHVWLQHLRDLQGKRVNCFTECANITLNVIIDAAFGGDLDAEKMKELWGQFTPRFADYFFWDIVLGNKLNSYLPMAPWNKHILKPLKEIKKSILEAIRERKEEVAKGSSTPQPTDRKNLLSALLEAKDENGSQMSDQQLLDESLTFLFAGHDTTSNLLSWTFYFLGKHPTVFRKLRQEVDDHMKDETPSKDELEKLVYCKNVLRESLRLRPPVPFVDRYAARDCEIGGVFVPAGTFVFPFFLGVHCNPKYWGSDSREFKPERHNSGEASSRSAYSWLPFSAGSRNCIGQKFALMEAEELLASIVKNFDIQTYEEDDVFMKFEGTVTPANFTISFVPRYRELSGSLTD